MSDSRDYIPLDEAERRQWADGGAREQPDHETPRSRALFWPELARLPRPEYLVKGVFDAGCLAEVFGPTSCGKSFFATDLGLHIAAGWDWNSHKVREAGVLYVNAEGGTAIINRLDAWRRHHSVFDHRQISAGSSRGVQFIRAIAVGVILTPAPPRRLGRS